MHAIRAQGAREPGIIRNEGGDALTLRGNDQRLHDTRVEGSATLGGDQQGSNLGGGHSRHQPVQGSFADLDDRV
jgi:hypothetical protein